MGANLFAFQHNWIKQHEHTVPSDYSWVLAEIATYNLKEKANAAIPV